MNLEGWSTQDFVDLPESGKSDFDPWGTLSPGEDALQEKPSHDPSNKLDDTPDIDALEVLSEDFLALQNFDQVDLDYKNQELDELELEPGNETSITELATLLEWDEELIDTSTNSQTILQLEAGGREYEPEALENYRDDLRQPLYEIYKPEQDWVTKLKVNEFISGVEDLSTKEAIEISSLLLNLSPMRLRSWLPWLSQQDWTGDLLVSFLRFWDLWDDSPEYWVHLRWSQGANYWFTWASRNSMTLDSSYQLIQNRLGVEIDQIIDPEWLEDWEGIDVWSRVAHDFYSFVAFAQYRAQLRYGEDWRNRSDFQVSLDSDLVGPVSAEDYRKTRPYRDWIRVSYIEQGWNDPTEWHDGLGW